jgi:chromosomal replication initiator protein
MNRLCLVRATDTSLELTLEDGALRPFLTKQHFYLLSQVAGTEMAQEPSVSLRAAEDRDQLTYHPKSPSPSRNTQAAAPSPALIPEYIFDRFFSGPSNRLAFAAAQAIARKPGNAFNPFLIHGQTGVGKTHILHAICASILENHPDLHVILISCRDWLQATEQGDQEYLTALGQADVVAVDNIHLIDGDLNAQDRFLHLFNHLHERRSQILLSSNRAPQEMTQLADALASRLRWGMVVELEPCTFEMKKSILLEKANAVGLNLSPDSIAFLASEILGGIRDLEGAIQKAAAYSSLLGEPLTQSVLRRVLREYLPTQKKSAVSTEQIQQTVCSQYSISHEEMISKKRSRSLVLPRHIAMYLTRSLTSSSLEEVGNNFGGRDHSTVKHGCEKIHQRIRADSTFMQEIESLKKRVLNGC